MGSILQMMFAHSLLVTLVAGIPTNAINDRPVIGVLTQASDPDMMKYGNEYLMSAYVKFLEMTGASVVTIHGAQPLSYYEDVFKKINGLIFPGGHVDNTTKPVWRSARILYNMAMKANDKGDSFPILGICQGFQMLSVLTADKYLLESVDAENISLPLTMASDYEKSRLFGKAPSDVINYLKKENITANFHNLCLPVKAYKQHSSLNKFYRVLSVNKGRKGMEFVSTMEAIHYPFYGLQWHPEKNIFTPNPDEAVSHTPHAIKMSQYIANFFVSEARKSLHSFPSEKERSHAVVENDKRIFLPQNYTENFFYDVKPAIPSH